jgi:hypothetical protein
MLRPIALVSTALLCLACGPNYKKRVPGVWKVDPASVTGDAPQALKDRVAAGKVTFEEDGTVNGLGLGLNGRWVVDGQKILLSSPFPDQRVQMPALTLNKEANRIEVVGPNGQLRCTLVKLK